MQFNIVVLYYPPSHNLSFYDDMKELLEMFDNSIETIFYGDFNINWADKRGRQELKIMMSKYNYDQLIKKANKSEQKLARL